MTPQESSLHRSPDDLWMSSVFFDESGPIPSLQKTGKGQLSNVCEWRDKDLVCNGNRHNGETDNLAYGVTGLRAGGTKCDIAVVYDECHVRRD